MIWGGCIRACIQRLHANPNPFAAVLGMCDFSLCRKHYRARAAEDRERTSYNWQMCARHNLCWVTETWQALYWHG